MEGLVVEVSAPCPSLVERALEAVDYADAFALSCPRGTFPDVDALARATTHLPSWIGALMALRNAIVKVFGLKTEGPAGSGEVDAQTPLRPGGNVGIFPVLARTDAEILMGLDDKHLDFRFSLLLARDAQAERAIATTLVRYRNRWGRFYFAVVKPFHRIIIPAMLRHALAQRAKLPA